METSNTLTRKYIIRMIPGITGCITLSSILYQRRYYLVLCKHNLFHRHRQRQREYLIRNQEKKSGSGVFNNDSVILSFNVYHHFRQLISTFHHTVKSYISTINIDQQKGCSFDCLFALLLYRLLLFSFLPLTMITIFNVCNQRGFFFFIRFLVWIVMVVALFITHKMRQVFLLFFYVQE